MSDGGIDLNRTTMQLHEGTHNREAEARAAMLGAERIGLEAVENPVLYLGRNSRTLIGDREYDGVVAPLDKEIHRSARGREADGVGQQIEQDLANAPFVGDEVAGVRQRSGFEA